VPESAPTCRRDSRKSPAHEPVLSAASRTRAFGGSAIIQSSPDQQIADRLLAPVIGRARGHGPRCCALGQLDLNRRSLTTLRLERRSHRAFGRQNDGGADLHRQQRGTRLGWAFREQTLPIADTTAARRTLGSRSPRDGAPPSPRMPRARGSPRRSGASPRSCVAGVDRYVGPGVDIPCIGRVRLTLTNSRKFQASFEYRGTLTGSEDQGLAGWPVGLSMGQQEESPAGMPLSLSSSTWRPQAQDCVTFPARLGQRVSVGQERGASRLPVGDESSSRPGVPKTPRVRRVILFAGTYLHLPHFRHR
jgi:hypothetical protein